MVMHNCIADLKVSVSLLNIIARRLGYDCLLLMYQPLQRDETWCQAVFRHYQSYDRELLDGDGKLVWIKTVNDKGNVRSADDLYAELTERLYKILESGGNLSDGNLKINADKVSEFMIGCDLNGYV